MAAKKSPKKQPSKNHKKISEAMARLNKRQRTYVEGVLEGKTKMQAALDAGYSEQSAKAASAIVEGTDVRAAFQQIMRAVISPEKIIQRIAEGLDAQETKFANYEGMITDSRDCIDYEQRRKYAEMAAKYGGYFVEKSEVDLNVNDLNKLTDEQLIEIAEGRGMVTHITGVGNA